MRSHRATKAWPFSLSCRTGVGVARTEERRRRVVKIGKCILGFLLLAKAELDCYVRCDYVWDMGFGVCGRVLLMRNFEIGRRAVFI